MKTYKTMYSQIYLEDGKKQEILQTLLQQEAAPENPRQRKSPLKKEEPFNRNSIGMPAYIAIFFCLILLPGATIFAMGNPALAERISTAFESLFHTQQDLSDGQKEAYAQHSQELDQLLQTENGTLHLDSILYDERYLFLPFTMDSRIDSPLPYTPSLASDFDFYFADSQLPLSSVAAKDPLPQEDGHWLGSYLLTAEEEGFHEGDVICIRQKSQGEQNPQGELLAKVTLPPVPGSQDISFPAEQLKEAIGLQIDKITLSPLSLGINGISPAKDMRIFCNSYLELQDGTMVRPGLSGSGGAYDSSSFKSTDFSYHILWETPVELDQVKIIHLVTNVMNEDGTTGEDHEILLPARTE